MSKRESYEQPVPDKYRQYRTVIGDRPPLWATITVYAIVLIIITAMMVGGFVIFKFLAC